MKKSILIFCLLFLTVFANPIHEDEESAVGNVTHGDGEHGEHEAHGVNLASWRWNLYSDYIMICLTIMIAAVLKLLFHHAHIISKHVPESVVLIIIGIIIGIFVYYGIESHSHKFPKFTSDLFFNVLLPPIILDSAYTLYDRDFLANLGSVVLFAVVGTLFNVFIIGYGLYLAANWGLMGTFDGRVLDSVEALIFSSLISAVDPVAVLAIFQEIGVNMGLYFLVFGESLLNDGVTVVLYNTMVALHDQATIATSQYIIAFFSFFTVCFGGLTIGIIIGWLTALFLKYTRDTRVIEPLVIFVMSYLAYMMAETVHWSGIISLIACGIAQKRYAFPNVSQKTYTTVKYAVKTMSSLADVIIFLFLGIVTISHKHEWHTGFALWTLGLCTVARFLGVYILSASINRTRIKPITFKEQFILSYGGLRGAVGFSLVTILSDGNQFKNIFLTTTLFIIFFTVFIQGSTIKLAVSKLHIQKKSTEQRLLSQDVNEKTFDFVMAGVASVVGGVNRYSLLEALVNFDNNYIKRWLLSDNAVNKLALRAEKISVSDHYVRLYAPVVLVHEKKVDSVLGEREDEKKAMPVEEIRRMSENIEWNRKTLRNAFHDNPYERYKTKNFRSHSEEDVHEQMHSQRQRWRSAISKLQSIDQTPNNELENEEEEEVVLSKRSRTAGPEMRKLLPSKDERAAVRIRKAYQRAKMQYKAENE